MSNNPSHGYLNIRTNLNNLAYPLEGVLIIVSHIIDNQKVIFFEGKTDESGMINNIVLPTPLVDSNDLVVPKCINYDIEAIYLKDNIDTMYNVLMYSDISVNQDITIIDKGAY